MLVYIQIRGHQKKSQIHKPPACGSIVKRGRSMEITHRSLDPTRGCGDCCRANVCVIRKRGCHVLGVSQQKCNKICLDVWCCYRPKYSTVNKIVWTTAYFECSAPFLFRNSCRSVCIQCSRYSRRYTILSYICYNLL